jgi:long-chain acyl-CoA synthetase
MASVSRPSRSGPPRSCLGHRERLVFPKVRTIFGKASSSASAAARLLEFKQQEFFNAIGVPVYQGYGLTENAPIICSNSARRHKFGTSGVVLPTLEVKIMKDERTECGVGEIGQIVTRGDSVMKGYFKNPQATAETIRDGRLWSGDLGYFDADGFLVVTGRRRPCSSRGREKYSPEAIEEAVANTSSFVNQIMAYNECEVLQRSGDARRGGREGRTRGMGADDVEVIALIRDDLGAFASHPDYSRDPARMEDGFVRDHPGAFDEQLGTDQFDLKLVRHLVREFHKDRIEEIYAGGSPTRHRGKTGRPAGWAWRSREPRRLMRPPSGGKLSSRPGKAAASSLS